MSTSKQFTVFCRESNDTGTTWIDTIELTNAQMEGLPQDGVIDLVRNFAVQHCAADWNWDNDNLDGITCICIIEGSPSVLFFEDLGYE